MKMHLAAMAAVAALALSACSTDPRPLVPDTAQGPTSYVCYNSAASTPTEVLSIAARQCGKSGLGVSGLIGQSFTPLRCGWLTPSVAAFQCGYASTWMLPVTPVPAPAMAPTPAPEPAQ